MVTLCAPLKVKAASVAVSIWPLLLPGLSWVSARAMCTFWRATGLVPFSLLSWMRICWPEMVGHTNWRSVALASAGGRLLGSVLWMVVAQEGSHSSAAAAPAPPAPPPPATWLPPPPPLPVPLTMGASVSPLPVGLASAGAVGAGSAASGAAEGAVPSPLPTVASPLREGEPPSAQARNSSEDSASAEDLWSISGSPPGGDELTLPGGAGKLAARQRHQKRVESSCRSVRLRNDEPTRRTGTAPRQLQRVAGSEAWDQLRAALWLESAALPITRWGGALPPSAVTARISTVAQGRHHPPRGA